jgi:hypothetical protein
VRIGSRPLDLVARLPACTRLTGFDPSALPSAFAARRELGIDTAVFTRINPLAFSMG